MNKSILSALLVMLTAFPTLGWAECTKEEAIQAETTSATLKSWTEIYSAFKKFAHCDDGAIAEGYSESVSQMLANHWDKIGDLKNQIKRDGKFEKFILRHVNQTISQENSAKISENVRKHCRKENKGLCKKIQAAMK